ncbi:HAMP domain-containing sensor histidine kinase [Oscillatoria sp. CS-180]|uniref:ATP-binding response regulator n=1 Tax=Oscillatoria sp. CS-180 TaxID=3021720 RepID=UPI002330C357|nr:HAMP domain-containing sensor histidine kinase [Oscillatoria sp. CS-180]MDB9525851.1 HAMP domain-containing sensor histidine kinase [Oscillatoria sp. CS-180]
MSKSSLLLLLNNNENRRLLIERLTPQFEIILPLQAASSLESVEVGTFDLIILDLAGLKNWHSKLNLWRQATDPTFLPVVALLPQNTVGGLPLDIRYQIDELVTTPVDPEELDIRIAILLRTRDLSHKVVRQNQQLEEMNRLKTRFVSVVSHEFRNPLSVISGMIQILETTQQNLSAEKEKNIFKRVRNSVSKLIALLDDLLVFDRNASSQVSFNPAIVDIASHCEKLLVDLESSTSGTRKINFQIQGKSSDVYVDTALIDTILNNLLSNALKYSPIGCPVELSLNYGQGELVFEVKDQGRGIPVEDQPALFDAFFRARNVGTAPGTGLGLSIVKQCVELHQGAIAFESQVDQGTTFTVTLPSAMDASV